MIPILYSGTETSFTSNGLGRLTDILECTCTEERNGIYEVEFTYPITGKFYRQMVSMVEAYSTGNWSQCGTIACIHDDRHDIQPFDLYSVSSPIDGIVTFNAHHISYRLGGMVTKGFSATSCADAIMQLPLKIVGSSPFTFWTDKATNGSFKLEGLENVRNILGGQEGSFLDVFNGGEYEFDKFNVKLYQNRGVNSEVTIRYGKNMTDVNRDLDSSGHFNAVAPIWKGTYYDEDAQESIDAIVTLSETYVKTSSVIGDPVIAVIDFSSDFDEMPTQAELRARAVKYLNDNKPWIPDENIKVSFIQLWQTTEYENVAILQRLSLCDQVNIYYEDLGIIANEQEIIKVEYNVILERYDQMELGKPESSLSNSISEAARSGFETELDAAKKQAVSSSMLQAAIMHATQLITGGLGGHVVFNLNADGQPEEILIMDTDDISTAVNVWRFNLGGLGHSHNGYNGPFSDVALTMDGAINANLITTGTMRANIIKGGTLSLGGIDNSNGVMRLYDASNNEIVTVDINGIVFTGTKHLYPSDGSYCVVITNDRDSPYFWEYPEDNYRNPSSYPNQIWYKRKVGLSDGGIVFYRVLTNNTSGVVSPPTETAVGRLRAVNEHVQLTSKDRLFLSGHNGGAAITLGQTVYEPSGSNIFTNSYQTDQNNTALKVSGIAFNVQAPIVFGSVDQQSNTAFTVLHTNYGRGLMIQSQYGSSHASWVFDPTNSGSFETNTLYVNGVYVDGTKSRVVETDDFAKRLLYCYEMPTPMFGDIGDSVLDEDGKCYIYLDPIFSETVDTSHQYQVFLQKYGAGDCWVSERKPDYFVVEGTPNLKFAWELKAKQFDYDNRRLDLHEKNEVLIDESYYDYENEAAIYIQNLEKERTDTE